MQALWKGICPQKCLQESQEGKALCCCCLQVCQPQICSYFPFKWLIIKLWHAYKHKIKVLANVFSSVFCYNQDLKITEFSEKKNTHKPKYCSFANEH